MPRIIEELKPLYGKCYDYADKILALTRPLEKKQTMTPREFRIYEHLMQARKSLWNALGECVLSDGEEQS